MRPWVCWDIVLYTYYTCSTDRVVLRIAQSQRCDVCKYREALLMLVYDTQVLGVFPCSTFSAGHLALPRDQDNANTKEVPLCYPTNIPLRPDSPSALCATFSSSPQAQFPTLRPRARVPRSLLKHLHCVRGTFREECDGQSGANRCGVLWISGRENRRDDVVAPGLCPPG